MNSVYAHDIKLSALCMREKEDFFMKLASDRLTTYVAVACIGILFYALFALATLGHYEASKLIVMSVVIFQTTITLEYFTSDKMDNVSVEHLCENLVVDAFKHMAYNKKNDYELRILQLKKRVFLGRASIEEIDAILTENSYESAQSMFYAFHVHNGFSKPETPFSEAEKAHDMIKGLIIEALEK
jgi:hypothetical protein